MKENALRIDTGICKSGLISERSPTAHIVILLSVTENNLIQTLIMFTEYENHRFNPE